MRHLLLVAALLAIAPPAFAEEAPAKKAKPAKSKPKANPTLGLGEMPVPADNPQTPEKIALGHQLFWDARLSKSGKMQCESCHLPDKGWADGQKVSTKDDGKPNTRNTPTVLNVGFQPYFYWDGRAATLEKQIFAAWKGQMGVADDKTAEETAKKIGAIPGYKEQFQKVFGGEATADFVVKALAAYVRTLVSGDSADDRFDAGDAKALTAQQKRGLDLFKSKAKCSLCHAGFAYTAWELKNVGVGMDKPTPDLGRGKVANDPKLNGAFKVPTLRNVARTAPYFHDGSAATLDAVLDYFAHPNDNPQLDEKMKGGVQLTPDERKDLLAFLEALNGSLPDPTPPKLP
jgi:cytochrome c peroxidase